MEKKMTSKHDAFTAKVREKKGSLLWELLIVLAMLFAFLYSAMMFVGAFIQFETLSYASKTVARQIEITGRYDDYTVQSNIDALLNNGNLHDIQYEISVGTVPADTDPMLAASLATQSKLQLRQSFTIRITAIYDLHLVGSANNSLLASWVIQVPMSYEVTGMSEVFWRN